MTRQLLAALGIVAGTGVALAALPAEEGPQPHRLGREEIKAELGLNDTQATQLEKLRLEARKAAVRRRADLEIARMELGQLVDASSPDERVIAAKVREVSELQAAALKARVDSRLAVGKVLTPEQREKLKELRSRGGRRGFGRGFGRRLGRGERPRRGGEGRTAGS